MEKNKNICIQTGLPCGMQCLSEEVCKRDKQETLEEFAKQEAIKHYSEDTFGNFMVRKSIEKGAKWQMDKQDNFAVGFAEWKDTEETQQLIIDLQMVGELPKETTTKQLLEIYKKEKGL